MAKKSAKEPKAKKKIHEDLKLPASKPAKVLHLEKAPKAYRNQDFLNSPAARPIRLLTEYFEPLDRLTLDFPADTYHKVEHHIKLYESIGIDANECYLGKTDYLLVYNTEEEIRNMNPDFGKMEKLDARGVIVTAKGNDVDFVSRFFGPKVGVNEDPVTGSAHTTLTPYWADKLGKNILTAIQLSDRKGYLECELKGDRVEISGNAVTYLTGEINV